MPFNLLKQYPALLELIHFNENERITSLRRVFERDFEENGNLSFKGKTIRPIKEEDGEPAFDTLFHHLTTRMDESKEGKAERRRLFEMDRSQRIHWIKYLIDELKTDNIEVFSYEDRVGKRDVIRTYVYDTDQDYVIILEPQRSGKDYYLLTAYYLNEKRGQKQIKNKLKKKLPDIH